MLRQVTLQIVCMLLTPALASAALLIAPQRVIFEGKANQQVITLVNRGDAEAVYTIGFENKSVGVDGSYTPAATPGPGEMFADKLLRYSPKRVTIRPGETQTIRLLLRKPAPLQEGEYRTHLAVRQLPPSVPPPATTATGSNLQFIIQPIYGVSIPVLVRHGNLAGSIDISSVALSPTHESLLVTFSRTGNRSFFGDVEAYFRPEKELVEYPLGAAKGVSALYPNERREFQLKVTFPEGVARRGTIVVKYLDPHSRAVVATKTTQVAP